MNTERRKETMKIAFAFGRGQVMCKAEPPGKLGFAAMPD